MLLEVRGLSCCYDRVNVLDSISVEFLPGLLFGLLGRNGSGKTTLLRALGRMLSPKMGVVLLDGKDVYRMPIANVAKCVGVVPQVPQSGFDFTALEVVLMGRYPHVGRFRLEGEQDLSIACQAMILTRCWEVRDRRTSELSGGEYQRVIIARAIAQQPKVLLLDEPTVHLDLSNQLEVLNLLHYLCRSHMLIVVAVFHDLTLAARYCDRLILLSNRRIAAVGTPEEVLTKENLTTVFSIDADVSIHHATKKITVTPLDPIEEPSLAHGVKVAYRVT